MIRYDIFTCTALKSWQ